MNESVWQSIASTPWWAPLLCAYALYISYLATKPVAITLRKLMLFPILVAVVSMLGMYALIKPTPASFACWGLMLMLGSGLGWLQYRNNKVKAFPGEHVVQMPGSWNGFAALIALVSAKYYFDIQPYYFLDPTLFQTTNSVIALMSAYGLITGLFLGRLLSAHHIVKYGPFIQPTQH